MLVSKGTQVSLDCIHNGNTKGNLNTSYNKEKSDFTDISEENCIESVTEQTKEGNFYLYFKLISYSIYKIQ